MNLWDKTAELPACICCCVAHTFEKCPAREWFGCRGQYTDEIESAEQSSWERVYAARGMTREEFYDL
jgi:hypothetical protein